MDEPTAALGPQETARTLNLIETLKAQGLAIILISHSLDEVFQVSNRIHVQRRGRRVGFVKTTESNNQEVLGMIVGAKGGRMMAAADTHATRTLNERLEPYFAIIGPMVMILALLLFMASR